jgi:hypothetical protein
MVEMSWGWTVDGSKSAAVVLLLLLLRKIIFVAGSVQ